MRYSKSLAISAALGSFALVLRLVIAQTTADYEQWEQFISDISGGSTLGWKGWIFYSLFSAVTAFANFLSALDFLSKLIHSHFTFALATLLAVMLVFVVVNE